jgi:hypothetical protein
MVKKGFAALLVAALTAVSVQALDFSWGMGDNFGVEFGGGLEGSASGLGSMTLSGKHGISYFTMSPYFFFDATYVELSAGILLGFGTSKTTWSGVGFTLPPDEDFFVLSMSITLGALGKFPIAVNDLITVFPLAGVTYQTSGSVDDKNFETVWDANGKVIADGMDALWFRVGIGMDVGVAGSMAYLRFAALYGLRMANKYETDLKETYEKMLEDYKNAGGTVDIQTAFGHWVSVQFALGFRL